MPERTTQSTTTLRVRSLRKMSLRVSQRLSLASDHGSERLPAVVGQRRTTLHRKLWQNPLRLGNIHERQFRSRRSAPTARAPSADASGRVWRRRLADTDPAGVAEGPASGGADEPPKSTTPNTSSRPSPISMDRQPGCLARLMQRPNPPTQASRRSSCPATGARPIAHRVESPSRPGVSHGSEPHDK